MPARNALKEYVDGGYYHVYNRGVNRVNVFVDEQDYGVFIQYLRTYLSPKDPVKLSQIVGDPKASMRVRNQARKEIELNNFYDRIDLVAYSLMPNHFHLCLKQVGESDMGLFMKSLMSRYTAYCNRRHKRVGPLWQGRYKAVLQESDEQLLYLTWYLHRNVVGLFRQASERTVSIRTILLRQPSSYRNYLGEVKQGWVKPESVLAEFVGPMKQKFKSYREFVESEDGGVEEDVKRKLLRAGLDV